jgi:heterodisulfide reductase subunit B
VFYISELAALAMGSSQADAWWRKHLTDPRPLLRGLGLEGQHA